MKKAQTLVKVVRAAEDDDGEEHLKVSPRGVVIWAGQVAWVKCQIPSKMAQSDSLFLSEPHESIDHLRYLDIGEGLLEIQPQSDPPERITKMTLGAYPACRCRSPLRMTTSQIPSSESVFISTKTLVQRGEELHTGPPGKRMECQIKVTIWTGSLSGNRTPVSSVTGGDTYHYIHDELIL